MITPAFAFPVDEGRPPRPLPAFSLSFGCDNVGVTVESDGSSAQVKYKGDAHPANARHRTGTNFRNFSVAPPTNTVVEQGKPVAPPTNTAVEQGKSFTLTTCEIRDRYGLSPYWQGLAVRRGWP
jgi:hypothetical protein